MEDLNVSDLAGLPYGSHKHYSVSIIIHNTHAIILYLFLMFPQYTCDEEIKYQCHHLGIETKTFFE